MTDRPAYYIMRKWYLRWMEKNNVPTDAGSCGDKRKNCSDEQLAQKAKGGDTDALAQLISHFLPVIKAKSGRYSLVGLEQDDFIQEGLIGLFKFDLVAFLFGSMTLLSRIIYTIVGICGIYLISFYAKKE